MPMAIHGSNIITAGRERLWLAWEGGKAPYRIAVIKVNGQALKISGPLDSTVGGISIGPKIGKKFSVVITDSQGQKLQVRFRYAGELPEGLPVTGTSQASFIAKAAWLTSQSGWSVEAVQMLHEAQTDAAQALRDRIARGWTYQPSKPD